MTPAIKLIVTACAAIVLASGLSACQKPEGPAERAGKSIDEATQKAGQAIEQAGQKIQDAADPAKK